MVEADVKDLHQLPKEFLSLDFYAFRLKIPDGDWSSEASEVAEEYLNKNPIIVEVKKPVLCSRTFIYYFILY